MTEKWIGDIIATNGLACRLSLSHSISYRLLSLVTKEEKRKSCPKSIHTISNPWLFATKNVQNPSVKTKLQLSHTEIFTRNIALL